MTNVSLIGLNCPPVVCAGTTGAALSEDHAANPAGVMSFDFVLVDSDIIDKERLAKIREQQPNAKVRLSPERR
jgi:hypothetical protein